MAGNITNIAEANQMIGALEAKLETEKEARGSLTAELQQAKADHEEQVTQIKADHESQVTKLKGDHATAVTGFTDQIEAKDSKISELEAKISELEGNAQTASEGAAKIVSQTGTEPVAGEENASAQTSKTPEELSASWAAYNKLEGSAEKRNYYLKEIKPFER